MNLQEQYDDAMFAFSQGDYAGAIARFKTLLAADPEHFDAQLALGMSYYRLGDYATAIAEGIKAEQLKPKEQLVHTNLSLFYMKAGDHQRAEAHGLQAKLAGWREDAQRAKAAGDQPPPPADPGLQMAGGKPQPMKFPGKFPEQPWKKKSS